MELALLGDLYLDVAGVDRVTEDLFFLDAHRRIFRAMCRLAATGEGPRLDVSLVADALGPELETAGGIPYLSKMIADDAYTAANLEGHLRALQKCRYRRQLVEAAEALDAAARNGSDPGALTEAVAHIGAISVEHGGIDAATPRARSLREIMADPEALKPPVPVAARFAYAGRSTVFSALPKLGKSTTVTAIAATVSRGYRWLGEPTEPGHVLYGAFEEHVGDVTRRLEAHDADPDRVHVLERVGDPFATLEAEAARLKPRLIIIDTLAKLVESLAPESGSASDWTQIMSRLTQLARDTGAAVLIVHHARRSDGSYRDSSAIAAGVDVVLEMREGTEDSHTRIVTARARWPVGNFAIRFHPDEETPRFELAVGDLSLDARVSLAAEREPGISKRVVCDRVEGRTKDILAKIDQLIERGVLRDEGTEKSSRLYPGRETPRETPTDESVSHEDPPENATETGIGNARRAERVPNHDTRKHGSGNASAEDYPEPLQHAINVFDLEPLDGPRERFARLG
jgi:hypothetical protein